MKPPRRNLLQYEPDRFLGGESLRPWQLRLNQIIFGVETPGGRLFDLILLIVIVLSILVVMLESVAEIRETWGRELFVLEWTLTLVFTLEYGLRLACVERPGKYATSFYGVIDVLAIMPSYLAIFLPGSQSLLVIRALRLLRVFRVLKLGHCLREAENLWIALRATRSKIMVFLLVVLTLVLIIGSTMYLIEGPENGFTSIPKSVYWAIVTMTTVGYGDIAPQTAPGQVLASLAMIVGYSIIIVPTGIFSVEVVAARRSDTHQDITCTHCDLHYHEIDARFCRRCGWSLPLKTRTGPPTESNPDPEAQGESFA